MSLYRTRTYIAADFDHDKDAVDQLYSWNNNKHLSLSFTDAHDLQKSYDSSLYCSIKSSLKYRLDGSKTFVLIVGDNTASVTKGGCQYCSSYNSHTYACGRGYSVDYRSYIEYECDEAVKAGIKIVVLYKSTKIDKSKCPKAVRNTGTHTTMIYYKDGNYYWDYQSVKAALEE
ncbi:MAG: TIR domain-containing protein [Clostridia bacterium]|nr:TIR domain-containing protein [Clostridia bacterium]